jgi:hypothetical protein
MKNHRVAVSFNTIYDNLIERRSAVSGIAADFHLTQAADLDCTGKKRLKSLRQADILTNRVGQLKSVV